MIIDTQVHIFERALVNIHGANFPWSWHECSAEWLVAEMDYAGVDKGILISYEADDIKVDLYRGTELIDADGWDPKLPENGGNIMRKQYYLDALKKYPDRFIWFTSAINLTKHDYWDIWMKDIEAGAVGLKLFPAYYGALPDDPRMMKVYEHCQKHGIPVIYANEHWTTLNYPRMSFAPVIPHTKEEYMKLLPHFENMLKSFPGVKFLLTHWGVASCWFDEGSTYNYNGLEPFVELLNKYENAYTDIAAISMVYGHEDYPWPGGLKLLKYLVEGAGPHKVMYGTDWPWCEYAGKYFQTVNMIRNAADFLNDEQKRLILGENAAKFVGIK